MTSCLHQICQVGLPELRRDEPTIAELKEIADNKGLGMSTLVRMWVQEQLAGNA